MFPGTVGCIRVPAVRGSPQTSASAAELKPSGKLTCELPTRPEFPPLCMSVCCVQSTQPGGTAGGGGGVLASVFIITAQRAVLVLYSQATAQMPPITFHVKLGHMLCSGQGVRSGHGAGHVLEGTLGAGFQLVSRGDGGRVDTMSGWPASLVTTEPSH